MSWASQRRALYLGGILLVLVLIVGGLLFVFLYDAPTCTDNKQNGDEEGIDCGGSCNRLCGFQAVDPIVRWSRFFEISPGVYTAVALVENPNAKTQAGPTPYTFTLRDAQNVLVQEIKGSTELPPERLIPIFEPNVSVGSRVPVRSTFSFDQSPVWQQATGERYRVNISDKRLSNETVRPRLDAAVRNDNLVSLSDITLVAILSDVEGNAVAVSQTVVSFLRPQEEQHITFTWPQPFATSVASIDIISKMPISK